jgi:hypothetical protein
LFKIAADVPLFCGEDLNFGAFSKYFPLGLRHYKAQALAA